MSLPSEPLWAALGRLKISKITEINDFRPFLTNFSRFLPQIICIYAIGTWKQHFLIKFRVYRGRRGPKWSFCLQNPSECTKIVKMTIFCNFEGFWRIFKRKWPFWASPTPRNPKSYQEMLFPCPCGIDTYNLGQKPLKISQKIAENRIFWLFLTFSDSQSYPEGPRGQGPPKKCQVEKFL